METGGVVTVTGIGTAVAVADKVCIGGAASGAAQGYDAATDAAQAVVRGMRKVAGDAGFDMDSVEVLRLEVRPSVDTEQGAARFEYLLMTAI